MVRVSAGAVRGSEQDGISVFKGIPYARSPFGEHRLAAPVPAEPWEGTREATAFGPRPPQATLIAGTPEWSPAEGLDCLTVNVWTPDLGGSGLPVMVWIYGGAYRTGSADHPVYDGARLAGDGVVVVTFNYRVSVEGFAWFDGAPANRWLLDQIAALRWVQENIAAFGGDPGKVTVFGESAGAGAVACLLSAPSARGLFHRAIAQSVPGPFYTPAMARAVSAAFMRRLGDVSPYTAAPEELVAASEAFTEEEMGDEARWGPMAYCPMPFAPVVDGEVLPDTPWNAVADGAGSDIPLIVGFTRDEFRMFAAMNPEPVDLARTLKALAPPDADVVYRAARPGAAKAELYEVLMSDWLFRMPSALLADAHTGPTYAYELTWASPAFGAAVHGLDVPLTFGTLDTPLTAMLFGEAPEAEGLSWQFRTAWTRFAATGDPGWPGYDPVEASTHLFDLEPADVLDPEAFSRALWSERGFPVID
ncbi:carboxylesterase family protein [Nonomuraea sp. NPDC046570]|uniref:carboxylesterase/lipase family protein n=1 Tax=Nonomuraea sp. NPDC046570 TaxID=3155255 RepID=UPI0033FE8E12